jgi:hypothetical protein
VSVYLHKNNHYCSVYQVVLCDKLLSKLMGWLMSQTTAKVTHKCHYFRVSYSFTHFESREVSLSLRWCSAVFTGVTTASFQIHARKSLFHFSGCYRPMTAKTKQRR